MPASAAVGSTVPGFHDEMQVTGLLAGRHECDGHATMHRHPEIEVNYIATGEIEYRYGGRSLTFGPGSLVVFWASVPHLASHRREGTVQTWFHLPVRVFRDWNLPITRRVLAGELVAFSTDGDYDRTVLDQVLADTTASRDGRQAAGPLEEAAMLTMRAYLSRLCLIERESTPAADSTRPSGRAAVMADHIIANAGDADLDVAAVAAAVGLHPTTAMREFRRTNGVTIGTFLQHHRISWAQQLLVSTDATTCAVGFDVGFASTSSFYAAFTKVVGMPPARFRRHVQGGG